MRGKVRKNLMSLLLIASLLTNFFLASKWLRFKKEEKSIGEKRKQIKVERVIDGDTFISQEGDYIRLAGIDAPEYPNQCLSQEAKERLTELISGEEIKIERVKKDKFGRTMAFVFKGQLFIDRILLSEGLGRVLEKIDSRYQSELIKAEMEAKKLKKGIWSSLCQPPKNCRIKGNYRRDKKTKIYHLPECYNYEKIIVNQKEGDRWFCNEEEARKAGFTKSQDCP